MCDVLGVPRSTCYKAMDKTISNRDQESHDLTERILEIYNESKGRYGAPKIHHISCKAGYHISLKRVQRLKRKADIRSITVKKIRPTPSKEGLIFHSDFGTQYISDEFANVIDTYNMIYSFSYKGSPYNNACIESFHATLKNEIKRLLIVYQP